MDCCCIRRQHQTSIWLTRECLNGTLDVSSALHSNGYDIDRKRLRRGLGCPEEVANIPVVWISYQRGARSRRRDLLEHRQPLPGDGFFIVQEAREIAARPRQAGNEPCANRVRDGYEHYRDRT